jgi:hypothetical protein
MCSIFIDAEARTVGREIEENAAGLGSKPI